MIVSTYQYMLHSVVMSSDDAIVVIPKLKLSALATRLATCRTREYRVCVCFMFFRVVVGPSRGSDQSPPG